MLQNPEIEAVYAAVPHHLHAKVYGDVIRAGKHLIGEKPFGLDREAFGEIQRAMDERKDVLVRCSSEFPFYPAVQKMVEWYKSGAFGQIIEAKFAIKHSSDMDLTKPINWKRTLSANGEYGCMGDLGIHTQHLPFRLGIQPLRVSAQLANIAKQRPNKDGCLVPCETWDNAILLCDGVDAAGDEFPLTFEMKRMAPGCTNTVEYEIYGMNLSAKFSSDDPNAIHFTRNDGCEQAWSRLVVGSKPAFATITGSIFEFGFSDSLLQMFAAFVAELRGLPCPFACFKPEEAQLSHRVLTAALLSQKEKRSVAVSEID
ncbi:MAG: Gfo/Idh/MocA family oxidoreductase [Eubacteriales bacterium]